MTPEQLAIAGLFATLSGVVGAVLRELWADNKRLRKALDTANQASADLIRIQANMLRKHGITPPEREEAS
jgi:hypothetical protein